MICVGHDGFDNGVDTLDIRNRDIRPENCVSNFKWQAKFGDLALRFSYNLHLDRNLKVTPQIFLARNGPEHIFKLNVRSPRRDHCRLTLFASVPGS